MVRVIKLGQRVKSERLRRGWSMRELSRRCGTNVMCICRLEKGEAIPSKDTVLDAIARELNIEIAELDQELEGDSEFSEPRWSHFVKWGHVIRGDPTAFDAISTFTEADLLTLAGIVGNFPSGVSPQTLFTLLAELLRTKVEASG